MLADTATHGLVLLVDDTPDTLRMLIDALEGAGFTALVARDGEGALQLLERVEPDVMLLDAVMPGMDGFELCTRIKAQDRFVTTPVLFMTGLSDTEHVLKGLGAGGVDYVVKPIRPDELIARIANHVTNARVLADARTALDASGAAVIVLDSKSGLLWSSEAAEGLFHETYGHDGRTLLSSNQKLGDWLLRAASSPVSETAPFDIGPGNNGKTLSLNYTGRSATGANFCRISVERDESEPEILMREFSLSQREAEVLLWLARGKANRDIGDILGVSPRTVTKHVEQILHKLNVENRTSAAILALKRCNI